MAEGQNGTMTTVGGQSSARPMAANPNSGEAQGNAKLRSRMSLSRETAGRSAPSNNSPSPPTGKNVEHSGPLDVRVLSDERADVVMLYTGFRENV